MICGNTVLEHFFLRTKIPQYIPSIFLGIFYFFLSFFFFSFDIAKSLYKQSTSPPALMNTEMGLKVTEPVLFSCKDVNMYSQESTVSSGVKEATAPKGAPDVGGSRQLQTSDWKPFCASQLPVEDVYSRSLSQGHSSLSGYLRVPKTDRPQFCTPLSLIPNQKRS